MDILVYIAFIIIGGLLNLVVKPGEKNVCKLARANVLLVLILCLSAWLFYFAGIKNEVIKTTLSFLLDWGRSLGHFILGYLLINILLGLRVAKSSDDSHLLKRVIQLTLLAVSIATGNSFILSTVGKATHFAEMTQFFTASGYAIWFLYFIMSAETLGGIGVLLHFKLKTGPLAAAGLMLIMVGAVYTHWHNKDPFSDSYAAVSQFITLSLMQVLYYFERQANKPSDTSIYIV